MWVCIFVVRRYRLVGVQHDIEHYYNPLHNVTPAISEQYCREYDPGQIYQSERWLVRAFEPVRTSFYGGKNPIIFLMPELPTAPSAEVVTLVGLHPISGGAWKLVYVFKKLRVVHVYEFVAHGRRFWWSLHLTTDVRFTLRYMEAYSGSLMRPLPRWCLHGAGQPWPRPVSSSLGDDLTNPGQ